MPIEKRTVFDRIELGNPLGIRLQKQLYDTDAEQVLSFEYHRTVITDDQTVAEQMAAVNAHLDQMKYPHPPNDVYAIIEAHRQLSKMSGADLKALMSAASLKVIEESDELGARVVAAEKAVEQAANTKEAAGAELAANNANTLESAVEIKAQ